MASEADDLEALFDSIADNRADSPAEPAAASAGGESEDDLEALFDAISHSQTGQTGMTDAPAATATENTASVAVAAPAASLAAEPSRESAMSALTEGEMSADIYEQVGRCTRHLHDAMRDLGYDQSLMHSTNEISSAKDRLEYVASLTEKAAVTVLNAVDEGLPEEDKLLDESRTLSESWDRMYEGKLSVEEFKVLAEQSRNFATLVAQTAERQKARMMEIMMAQDFQDITGQIIKKIVGITQAHELELMKILRENAPEHVPGKQEEKSVDLMSGPDLPMNALAQDDVDNLLADLGF